MGLNILHEPSSVQLSRNAIPLIAQTDSLYIQSIQGGYSGVVVDSDPSEGDELGIVWKHNGVDYSVTLVFTATPDDSGNEVALMTGGTVQNYFNTVFKEAIEKHPLLHEFFEYNRSSDSETVMGVNDHFMLLNKKWGMSDYGIVANNASFITISIFPTPNPIAIDQYDGNPRDDMFLAVKVYVEDEFESDQFDLIAETHFKPFPDEYPLPLQAWLNGGSALDTATIEVDIHELIEPYLRNHAYPDMTSGLSPAYEIIRELNKRFRIEVWEYYNGQRQGIGYRSNPFHVIHGGLDKLDLRQYFNYYNNYFVTRWAVQQKRYLTYRPTEREVTKEQSHHLYWLCGVTRGLVGMDPEDYYLKAKVYYTDNTEDTTTAAIDTSIKRLDTVRFRSGFDDLNLGSLNPSKTPYKYEVWVEAQSGQTIIGRKITFHIMEDHYLQRYVRWRNSFGGWECTRFVGESKLLAEVEKEFAETLSQSQPGVLGGTASIPSRFTSSISYKAEQKFRITLETGAISQEDLMAHADMLRNDYLYLDVDTYASINTVWGLPFKVVPGSFELGYKNQNGDHIYGVRMTLELEDTKNFSSIQLRDNWN